MLRFLNKHRLALIFFISIHFFLSLYSNQWGLPSRWHADEKVANVLHMASQKVLYDPHGAFFHPTGYHIVLLLLLIPYYLYLTVTNYPLAAVKQAASVSWINMAHQFPEFATDIYVYARSCSALLSIFTMYFIYAIGKKIYNKTAGLVAAGSYAVCMGVVGINHFAKYISLLNLLIVLTIYFSISALQYRGGSRFNKYLLLAFLSAGFSSSIHINGPTLLLPTTLALFFWIHCHHWKGIVHHSIICLFSFITGILAGTPSLLTHFGQYFYVIMGQFHRDTTFSSQKIVVSSTSNIFGYFFEMMSIFGIPLFVFILMGLFMILINFRRISREEMVTYSFPVVYFFLMSLFYEGGNAETKNIIAAIPLTCLFAGAVFFKNDSPKIRKYLKVLYATIFLYSCVYSFSGLSVFKDGDPRYALTTWIRSNIPKNSKIEVFDQLGDVASESLFYDYEILYLGNNSKVDSSKNFFYWLKAPHRIPHLNHIRDHGSDADYIIFSHHNLSDFLKKKEPPLSQSYIPYVITYIQNLFANKTDFRLIQKFEYINKKKESQFLKGFYHFENLWWYPAPSSRETTRSLYLFKKMIAN